MRSNPTDADHRPRSILRDTRLASRKLGYQQAIGPYIVDFVTFGQRPIIEADGSQHVESEADVHRTAGLEARGFRVGRFWNDDIAARTGQVAGAIWHELGEGSPPLPNPFPARGEGLRGDAHA